MLELLITSLELGLLYSFIVFSVFISYRILDFPDLSVDIGTTTGAGTFAVLVLTGFPMPIAFLIGLCAGGLSGFTSAFLHTWLRIHPILSGVLTLSIFWTITLRIMGKPNIALLGNEDIFPLMQSPGNHLGKIIFLACIVLAFKYGLDWFLKTEFGLMMRATGKNESTVKSFGTNPDHIKWIGLFLAGATLCITSILSALYIGFVDLSGGIGNIVLGIAGLMLGEALMKPKTISQMTWAVIVGTIVYETIITLVLRIGLSPADVKIMTAIIVVFAIFAAKKKK